jgi:hypothetical protein
VQMVVSLLRRYQEYYSAAAGCQQNLAIYCKAYCGVAEMR